MPLRILIAAVLLITALGLGGIAYKALSPKATLAKAEATTGILVAARPLQAGTLIKDADVSERKVPITKVPEGAYLATDASRGEIRGAMLRHYLDPESPVLQTEVLRPRDRGFLAAVLAPGTRAVSIGVTAKTGAAGLISPGDLVDVILTQEFSAAQAPLGRRVVAETIMTGVRVIAVDQNITQGAPDSAAGKGRVASTVTLQVTPEQAEKLVVAQRLGSIDLAVRPIDKPDQGENEKITSTSPNYPNVAKRDKSPSKQGVVFGSSVSSALTDQEPSASPHMRVIQGGSSGTVVFK